MSKNLNLIKDTGEKRTIKTVGSKNAIATPTHMAIVKLIEEGYVKHLISSK
jgi:hypothetical protein